jgi:hypothetical protein
MEKVNKQHNDGIFKAEALNIPTRHSPEFKYKNKFLTKNIKQKV